MTRVPLRPSTVHTQPFVPEEAPLRAWFPPRALVALVPAALLCVAVGGVATFVGAHTLLKSSRRKQKTS